MEVTLNEETPAGEPIQESPSLVFLLYNLSFDPYAYYPGQQYSLPDTFGSLAEIYFSPLKQILSSRLNSAGLIRAIYVNFGPMGYYELNPNSSPLTDRQTFVNLLYQLFQDKMIRDPGTNKVIWHKITDFSSVMSSLPGNFRKISCLYGAAARQIFPINFYDYVRNASDGQSFVFMVGNSIQDIGEHIDAFLQVSDEDRDAAYCMSAIIMAMEAKCGLQTSTQI